HLHQTYPRLHSLEVIASDTCDIHGRYREAQKTFATSHFRCGRTLESPQTLTFRLCIE
ncbi:hypothetical protein NPIL_266521, partial [Nephila pilipes]